MKIVALTGGIGSGKSTVAEEMRGVGCEVIDADALAHAAVAAGTDGLASIVAAFGEEILDSDGNLDRSAVARRVFESEEDRRTLESIVHPRVFEGMRRRVADLETGGFDGVVVLDIPLLFETGQAESYETVIVVDCPEEERVRRLVEGRGMEAGDVRARIRSQWPLSDKVKRATHVVDNAGTSDELRQAVGDLVARLADELS